MVAILITCSTNLYPFLANTKLNIAQGGGVGVRGTVYPSTISSLLQLHKRDK